MFMLNWYRRPGRIGSRSLVFIALCAAAILGIIGLLKFRAAPTADSQLADSNGSGASTEGDPPEVEPVYENRLIDTTSPYLLQHAHNPVDWYPWGDEAFEKARREDKPIFLSVGYSTCYWCHVMEKESFEDEEVAEFINAHFVPIKVDREQRPDIDEQYMMATQVLTRRGGWPNSVWLTPAGEPWMAGTYFPKEQFLEILKQLSDLWQTRRDEVEQQAMAVKQASQRMLQPSQASESELSIALVDSAIETLLARYDREHGGFGRAPKFPPHGQLRLLLQRYKQSKDNRLLSPIEGTLDAMWLGGIQDHIGGGFHRYSTDQRWLVPHFEKMLYDNAQLMRIYSRAFELTGRERYRDAVEGIFDWLEREMTASGGAFYSAMDAGEVDAEGEFYLWTIDDLNKLLSSEEAELFAEVYNFSPEGNFEEEASGERTGENIPHLTTPIEQIAHDQDMDAGQLRKELAEIRAKLLAHRIQQPHPHKDDKVLTGWNGLMIGALAQAGIALEEKKYVAAAERAASFLLENMFEDGTLLRSYRDDTAGVPGYLDDHAYLISGLLHLYRATDDRQWLQHAQELAAKMRDQFEDEERGGFFFTSSQHDPLMLRSKFLGGGGNVPSPNAIAAGVLLQLARITGEASYRQAAEETLNGLSGTITQQPTANEDLLLVVSLLLSQDDDEQTEQTEDDTPT